MALTHYRLAKRKEQDIKLKAGSEGVEGITSVGAGAAKDDEVLWLSDVLAKLNDILGSGHTDSDVVNYARTIADKIQEDDQVMRQVRSNSPEQVMLGDFPGAVQDAVLASGQAHQAMMLRVLEDRGTAESFARLLLEILLRSVRIRP